METKFTLRPYQNEVLDLLSQRLATNPASHLLVQLPTGMGKTVVFATHIARQNRPALVIAHREELLTQAKGKIAQCGIPENKIDIVLQSQPDPDALVWVASIQTLVRGGRMAQIAPSLIVIDEAHHSVAKTYQDVLAFYPGVPVIGFTATPTRTSQKEKKELAKIWGEVVYQYPIKKAMLDGHLARIEYYEVVTGIDLNDVKTVAGDFKQDELAKKVNVLARNQACVDKYLELGGGKAVVFCVDVAHAEEMASVFCEQGIDANCLVGDTHEDTRHTMLDDFGKSPMLTNKVLTNCMVLTEGWDCPDVRMIMMARPTQSPIVYLQQLGRGTRIAPGKDAVIVVDIADNCKKDKLRNCLTTVFGLNPNMKLQGDVLSEIAKKEAAAKEVEETDIQEAVTVRKSNLLFDMPMELEQSALAWYSPKAFEYYCAVAKQKYLLICESLTGYTLYGVNTKGRKELARDTELEPILEYAWTRANIWFKDTRYMWDKSKRKNWSNNPPTPGQIEFLAKIDSSIDPTKISKATAGEIISAYTTSRELEPATHKQIYFLQSRGISWEGDLTRREAGKLIQKQKELEEGMVAANV